MDVVLNGNCQQSVSIIKNINEINDLQLSTAQMELSTVFLVNSISMGGRGVARLMKLWEPPPLTKSGIALNGLLAQGVPKG